MAFRDLASALLRIGAYRLRGRGRSNDCMRFFEALDELTGGQTNKRAELIEAHHPEGCCEAVSVSPNSCWGPVNNVEFVFRMVFSPLHVDPVTGEVNAALFQDVADKGLSCDRALRKRPGKKARERGIAQAQRHTSARPDAPRVFEGVVVARAAEIRMLSAEGGKKPFAIYDTGLQDNPSHIDVFQLTLQPKSEQKRMRRALQQVFTSKPV